MKYFLSFSFFLLFVELCYDIQIFFLQNFELLCLVAARSMEMIEERTWKLKLGSQFTVCLLSKEEHLFNNRTVSTKLRFLLLLLGNCVM